MSSLPPSSTPSAGDDSAPESLSAAVSAVEPQPVAPFVATEPLSTAEPAQEPAPGQAQDPAKEDCGPQLKKLFPALFSNPPKPLKLRIQGDIQARSPGLFTKPQLSAFLRRYTGSHAYLNAIVKATHRYDLDGNAGDALSDEHRQAAIDELARRRANTQARRALEDEQRFNRSILLRDFAVTKLTPADFAALKGVPEAELEPLLERARKEALEPPPPPVFNRDRRPAPARSAPGNGPGPRTDGARDPQAPRADGPRGPRPEGQRTEVPRGPRPEGAQGEQRPEGPRTDAPRGPRPDGQHADAPRGPRPDGQRGPRPEGQRGARPDGQRGPRPDGSRNANGPRSDAPRGPRNDNPRGPRSDAPRMPRPEVISSPAVPTAMAAAFLALRAATTGKTPAATESKAPTKDTSTK